MTLRSWIRPLFTRAVREVRRRFRPTVTMLEDRSVPSQLGDVFYINLENHNFTQPNGNVNTNSWTIEHLKGNPAAPYLNSLITPGNPNAALVSYATNYHNVLATPLGNGPSIHPSEPNYVWQESGTNGPLNDNDPFPSNVVSAPNLTGLLQNAGISWKSYQEGIDLVPTSGSVNQPGPNALTSAVAPQNQWSVPLSSFNGASASYTNPYNGSHQYGFATKHDGTLFFTDTNGGNNSTPSNPETSHYAPLQQLAADLASNSVGRYNLITPDLYNDMHTALSGGFTYNGVTYNGDAASIAQGDNFLSQLIPMIEASSAFKNNGEIVIWNDESEAQDANDSTLNDFNHDITEIVISPLARGNAYASTLNYTHSSDLKTVQEIFAVQAPGGGFLGAANTPGTNDLSDLFKPLTFSPTLNTSQQPASATVGTVFADQATVGGGDNPTGTVTFNLYSNPSGTGTPLFTDTETLVSGTATSKGFTVTASGTDYWVVTYNGDSSNTAITSGTASEPVTVSVASPTLTTSPLPASAPVGMVIADEATVVGGDNPTGTVTFNFYSNPSGTGTPLFTDTETLVSGTATSRGFTVTASGTDYWVATYNGDSNNAPVTSGAASAPVTITATTPQPTPTAHGLHFAPATGHLPKGRQLVTVQVVDAGRHTVAQAGVTITLTDTFTNPTTHHKTKLKFTRTTNSRGSATFTISTAGKHSLSAAARRLTSATENITVKP